MRVPKLMPLPDKDSTREISLPPFEGWPVSVHDLTRAQGLAINTALTAGRPLLVRGKPGTGKTQLARAAAVELGRHFVFRTLDAYTEGPELRWRLDAVRRLAEAQVRGAAAKTEADIAEVEKKLAELRFVEPGVLWWGFSWEGAADLEAENKSMDRRVKADWVKGDAVEGELTDGVEGAEGRGAAGSVILLDEIDKADPVLPNALLEVLGTGRFDGPPGKPTIECVGPKPLVIITTNEEREMSAAFKRRCVVLPLALPSDPDELKALLVRRAQQHLDARAKHATTGSSSTRHSPPSPIPSYDVLMDAAQKLIDERVRARQNDQPEPGQAEYLDLVLALWRMDDTDEDRLLRLQEVSRFVLRKHLDGGTA